MKMDVTARFEALDTTLKSVWEELFQRCRFIQTVQRGEVDKKLYALYMLETYHYTRHNARNQALVGVRALEEDGPYLRFCFEHAKDEAGHELMAMHDILSLGLKQGDFTAPPPLPATEVLIAYLYWISATGNPLRRLGYSYWAESVYRYINPLIARVQQTLNLKSAQMTFFIAHAKIDAEHEQDVRKMLAERCRSDQDWADVERVMTTSLRLTGEMMEDVSAEYERLVTGKPTPYRFLDALR
jgi:thiaminase